MRRHALRILSLVVLAGQLQQVPAAMVCALHHRKTDCASGHYDSGPVVRATPGSQAVSCASKPCCGNLGSVFVASRADVDDVAAGPAALVAPVPDAPADVVVLSTSPPPKV